MHTAPGPRSAPGSGGAAAAPGAHDSSDTAFSATQGEFCSPANNLLSSLPVLQVHPTRRCNLACAHCYTESGPHVTEALPVHLLASAVADAAQLGYGQLAVSGGEPLLYRDLPALLAAAKAMGMITTVTSNAMLATPKRLDDLVPVLDGMAVSIDGRPEEHDRIRGQAGAFDKAVANLAHLRERGLPFAFIFTLTQHNADSLAFVLQLARDTGARAVQVHPLTADGRAARTLSGAIPDPLELLAGLMAAEFMGAEMSVPVQVDVLLREQIERACAQLVPQTPVRQLKDAAPVLIVSANGQVLPYTHAVHPALALGNLHQARLSELAADWLRSGRADRLAQACGSARNALLAQEDLLATYWYDTVAEHTHRQEAAPLLFKPAEPAWALLRDLPVTPAMRAAAML
jgi:MoaA/NifB/PqqE/SkfB family radical SAM enzyme